MVGDVGKPVLNFLESISHAFFKLVAILMKAAPIGAFGAFAFTIGKYGIGSIANLAALVATFYITAASSWSGFWAWWPGPTASTSSS
jgi:aerobic C4-dicarboxylate transport protein